LTLSEHNTLLRTQFLTFVEMESMKDELGLPDFIEKLLKDKQITTAEYINIKNQERILEQLHKIEMKLDGLQIITKYKL
jgi:replicative superfamily II helicase